MPTFKDELLRDAADCCRGLYTASGEQPTGTQGASQRTKADNQTLLLRLRQIQLADPFPAAEEVDGEGLRAIALGLRDGELALEDGRVAFFEWAEAHFPLPVPTAFSDTAGPPAGGDAGAGTDHPGPPNSERGDGVRHEAVLPSPGNLRMMDNVLAFRSEITNARRRLRKAGDLPDQTAYKNARNRYVSAADLYATSLRGNFVDTPLEDNVTFERTYLSALRTVTGAELPAGIDAATNFIDDRLFPIA